MMSIERVNWKMKDATGSSRCRTPNFRHSGLSPNYSPQRLRERSELKTHGFLIYPLSRMDPETRGLPIS
jgi:hypothetical protein